MDERKKIVVSAVLTSLGIGAYYLLREDFKDLIESVKVEEKKEVQGGDFWEGMTWDKLHTLLGSKLKNDNIMEAYYLLDEKDKMNWRRAVYGSVDTSLDRAFVYLDARTISQVYPTLTQLKDIVSKYSHNEASFKDMYAVYRASLHQIFGIG
ncbi:hypothetical protein AciM339_1438 [Aciduliprofundum sp. MAR08-339]|uniref:hypothetical protein n=1 Tax=Aciduliprofundum sp. (strain MAR08-339) TaxID=673860 RepID=UPI0002A48732|nr:hypothetical protein AciM339_1438 [Aciduliprofundum sp. MAR08-339]